jgi:hypothetical protein
MKTLIYLIITILICITLPSSAQKSFETSKEVILKTTDSKATSQSLMLSAKIISARLNTYGLDANVSIIGDKGQIKVLLKYLKLRDY